NQQGYIVLTESFHLKKGYCCGNGCKHCPYNYDAVPEPRRSDLRTDAFRNTSTDGTSHEQR
ncbi:MAG: hypothetical protein EOO03_05880, partial [Chitinophagaceae bacterium]